MRIVLVWVAQIGILVFPTVAAFLLRFDFSLPAAYLHYPAYALPILVLVKIVVSRAMRLDPGLWWYVSVANLVQVVIGNLATNRISSLLIDPVFRDQDIFSIRRSPSRAESGFDWRCA